jgi:hypothetical protein
MQLALPWWPFVGIGSFGLRLMADPQHHVLFERTILCHVLLALV